MEDNLIKQLNLLGYGLVTIKDESNLLHNLKGQLEKHNGTTLSDKEFAQVLNKLNKGNVFERAKILRDKILYNKDNGDAGYLELINQEHWCQNQFQVTRQVNMEGSYKNRYDVTLLVNGLPIIHIELKRRGLELKGDMLRFVRAKTENSTREDEIIISCYINGYMKSIIDKWRSGTSKEDSLFDILQKNDDLEEQKKKVGQFIKKYQ